jgi:DNA mismatch endonuclease (patch repair protein)
MDIVSPQVRSRMMSGIRGKDTRPELRVRTFLHGRGLRYVLGGRGLPGRPDIVFPSRKAVVFVHGCYWHRHPGCPKATTPKTRTDFWVAKFEANVARDRRVEDELRQMGWNVFVVWECETADDALGHLADHLQALPKVR